ncbi:MAG: WYL domain-containing protein [Betaproteobacteria bacterium]
MSTRTATCARTCAASRWTRSAPPSCARRAPGKSPPPSSTHLGAGYGIFAGKKVEWATLRFTPEAARWVAAQSWHPKQRSRFEEDGSYVLELPYSEDRELLMEILKFGADVEVLAPASLRSRVAASLAGAASRYR